MSVPAIGSIVTPTNFLALSQQGQVQLTWSASPLATIYYVNRSTDNVTFTNIGSTVSLSYSDLTATVGTIYYYTVQAATSSASSPSTYSLAGQALNPGQTTVGNLRLEAQQRTDRVYSNNISAQEWNSMISQSYKELYDILIQKFGNDYFVQLPYTYTTTGQIDPVTQAQTFPLPSDFYKLLRCEVALNKNDPNSWITLRQFQAIQANLWNYPNVYTFYGITNLRYRLWGNNLQLVPLASAGQTIRIWYAPRPNQLINDTDTLDAISGYEEYIVADVAIKALAKTEEDPQVFMLQKAALLKRIEEAAENRNVGEPQQVSDSRTRNFAWTDSSGEFGSGSGMW
jgi:hypothetical protein